MSPRRVAALMTCIALAGAPLVACSKDSRADDGARASSGAASSSGAGATTSPASEGGLSSAPAEVTTLVTALYAGKPVASAPWAQAPLKGRKAATSTDVTVDASFTEGTWGKTPIAVVTLGEDVTLLTKEAQGWSVAGGWWPSLAVPGPVLGPKRFVAFLGVDARKGESVTHSRADAIQVLGYTGGKEAALLGMARDTWVTLPDGSQSKINGAMVLGGGPTMVGALKKQIGVDVSRYLSIDFRGFITMVNELGGLDITLTRDTNVGYGQVLRKGKNHLRGNDALRLARNRKNQPAGDFSRSDHQGMILIAGALAAKAGGAGGLPEVLTVAGRHVKTDMPAAEALVTFALPFALDLGKVHNKVSAGSVGWSADGQSIVLAGPAEKALYADFQDAKFDK